MFPPKKMAASHSLTPKGWGGRKFLEAPWLHTTEHDQGPFDETILEMLKLEVCDGWKGGWERLICLD